MPENQEQYTDLFNRLLKKELSSQDAETVAQWLGEEVPDTQAARLILQQLQKSAGTSEITPELIASLESRLPFILSEPKPASGRLVSFLRGPWLRYAAAFILVGGLAAWLWSKDTPKQQLAATAPVQPVGHDVLPGKQGAILTLADGSTVVLDSISNGVIARQNGSKLVYINGQLKYEKGHKVADAETYNTMSTPKGRMFSLSLPDGSKVWLNAASSLRYPTIFTGKERRVEVSGEAYFEIARNSSMPFRVKISNGSEVEVLGTNFNVNSYTEEDDIHITLLEGAVRCLNGNDKTVLKPGQQAQIAGINTTHQMKVVNNADTEKVMAWKNGIFNFNDATLEEVMHQLERWYDLDVIYEKGIPKLEFIGKMGRDLTLSEVLAGLEMSKVHFRIEKGRKLIIMP